MKFYQWMNSRRNKKGFTLIELIIVIAILAILAAILIPNMITYIEEAKQSTADTNARTSYSAATAAQAFILSQGKDMPADGTVTIVMGTAPTGDFATEVYDLLGENFKGTIAITVAADNVTSVTWTDPSGTPTATYPK